MKMMNQEQYLPDIAGETESRSTTSIDPAAIGAVKRHRSEAEQDEIERINALQIRSCPHCGCMDFRRDGHASTGLLIRECKGCGRKFTPLTGTIFDCRKIPLSRWFDYCVSLFDSHSILSFSSDGRNPYSTCRYWLSKVFLVLSDYQMDTRLSGRVYMDEMYVPACPKNVKRRANGRPTTLPTTRLCITSATADGKCYLAVAGVGKPSTRKMLKAYMNHIAPESVLVHDGEDYHTPVIQALHLSEEVHPSKSTRGLRGDLNPMEPINAITRELKRLLTSKAGYRKAELAGCLNLVAFDLNTPGTAYDKAKVLLEMALTKRAKLRYRDWSGSKTIKTKKK